MLRNRRAVATIEFALIAPVMIALVFGVFDISKGVILWQQVYNASRNIPVSASNVSVQADKSTQLTALQAQQAMSTIYAEMPWLRDQIETNPNKSVTLSSVAFVPISGCIASPITNCFQAYVTWSASYNGGAGQSSNHFLPIRRPCGILTQKNPSDPVLPAQLMSTLRTLGISEPDPILVADVWYQYTPVSLRFIGPVIDFRATGYWSVRSVDTTQGATQQYTSYTPADSNVICVPPPANY